MVTEACVGGSLGARVPQREKPYECGPGAVFPGTSGIPQSDLGDMHGGSVLIPISQPAATAAEPQSPSTPSSSTSFLKVCGGCMPFDLGITLWADTVRRPPSDHYVLPQAFVSALMPGTPGPTVLSCSQGTGNPGVSRCRTSEMGPGWERSHRPQGPWRTLSAVASGAGRT